MLSFEAWMQQGQDFATDLTPVVADDNPLASLETEQLKSTLSKFLRPKEMEALSWRYGLQRDYVAEAEEELFGRSPRAPITVKGRWGEAMSFTEVGKKMKVSAEYGRRLCHKALNKLRVAAEEGMLEPALLL
jgi:DNA-directed RNA polymerase sigma subunit (sigma70/sigma32)